MSSSHPTARWSANDARFELRMPTSEPSQPNGRRLASHDLLAIVAGWHGTARATIRASS